MSPVYKITFHLYILLINGHGRGYILGTIPHEINLLRCLLLLFIIHVHSKEEYLVWNRDGLVRRHLILWLIRYSWPCRSNRIQAIFIFVPTCWVDFWSKRSIRFLLILIIEPWFPIHPKLLLRYTSLMFRRERVRHILSLINGMLLNLILSKIQLHAIWPCGVSGRIFLIWMSKALVLYISYNCSLWVLGLSRIT